MSTDNITLLILSDLINRRLAKNRQGVYRLMKLPVDPFPQPILLYEGKPIAGSTPRFAGRRVAWRAAEVEAWLNRRARYSKGSAA